MNEATKAYARRSTNPFYARVIRGEVLDIGCGHDLMPCAAFPAVTTVRGYDIIMGHKGAQTLADVGDELYDTVHSSHCLEHLHSSVTALFNWLRVLKPGGHMVVTVPDWDLYEHRQWPSRFNTDHKWAFTLSRELSVDEPHVLSVPLMLDALETLNMGQMCACSRFGEGFDYQAPPTVDQTLGACECAIEFVFQKAIA